MTQLITFINFYYKLAGKKLFLLFFLMIAAVGFHGISISLFLPILQGEDSDSKIAQITRQTFNFFGIEYTLLNLLLIIVGFFFVRSFCLIGQASYVGKIVADLLVNLRCTIAEKIFQLEYQAYLKKSTGYLSNALIVEFQKVVFSFEKFSNFLVSILFVLMYVGIPFCLNPFLILVLAGAGLPLFIIIKKINALTKKYSVQTTKHNAGLQQVIIQALRYFKYLKATSEHPTVLKQIFNRSRSLGKLQFKGSVLGAITEHGLELFIVLVVGGVIFYYVELKGQDIIENIFVVFLLMNAMKMIMTTQQSFRKLLSAWGSIEVLKSLKMELENSKERIPVGKIQRSASFDQTIRFENVCFSFNNGVEILKNINLTIPPNSTVALVGESGAGKTTLINLLIGLLRPTEGTIYIGDIAYQNIDPNQIRKKVGYITQENVIFNDTIYNNIILWKSNGLDKDNMEKVKSAINKAHIGEFIRNLKNGYDSVLGEGGINISGGQRQRICIARELYKNAEILIFDEATSSLDTKTEREIQKNIDEFKGQKTIVIVAHRLSTVRNSDKIFVLKDGIVEERGSYEELLGLNGEFKRMVVQQNY